MQSTMSSEERIKEKKRKEKKRKETQIPFHPKMKRWIEEK